MTFHGKSTHNQSYNTIHMPQFKSGNSIKGIFTIRIAVVWTYKVCSQSSHFIAFFSFDSLELLKATTLLLQLLQMIPFKSTFLLNATRITTSIYLSTNLYGSLKRRRRAQMVASTIAMMVSPNSMIKLGGHHVFLFLIFNFSVEKSYQTWGTSKHGNGITLNHISIIIFL